jgi:hypothetical protein
LVQIGILMMVRRRLLLLKVLLLAGFVSLGAAEIGAAGLEVFPQTVELNDVYARRQLIVTRDQADVTRQVSFASADPKIAEISAHGIVTPIAIGSTEVTITHQGLQTRIPVRISAIDVDRPIDFANEIVPLLSRYGCNAGGCHGKASRRRLKACC